MQADQVFEDWHTAGYWIVKTDDMHEGYAQKIFLVDDDIFSRAIHEQHFRNMGCERYHSFSTIVECISRFDEKPDILILDYRSHPERGLKILSAIRKVLPHAYIVFMTGPGGIIESLFSLKQGAFAYIIKDKTYPQQLAAVLQQIDRMEKIVYKKP